MGGEGGILVSLLIFFTAAVWCVPFSGAVGLFNKLQTQKKKRYILRVLYLSDPAPRGAPFHTAARVSRSCRSTRSFPHARPGTLVFGD